jgi:hypothetical protein
MIQTRLGSSATVGAGTITSLQGAGVIDTRLSQSLRFSSIRRKTNIRIFGKTSNCYRNGKYRIYEC